MADIDPAFPTDITPEEEAAGFGLTTVSPSVLNAPWSYMPWSKASPTETEP